MSRAFDTLVIGAGVAGLMAGLELARAGQRVIILEARDRIGGRILTEHHDAPLELGAEFVHGLPGITCGLLRDAGLSGTELYGTTYQSRGAALSTAEVYTYSASDTLQKMARWLAQQPIGTDVPFQRYLEQAAVPADEAAQASRYVEGFNAADRSLIGIAALARQQAAEDAIEGDRLFHLAGGYDALPRHLAESFAAAGGELRLSHAVDGLLWRRDTVSAVGTRTAFELRAQRAVITVPLGVLKAGSLRFDPSIPQLTPLVQGMEMGPVLRLAFLFRRPFWATAAPGMLFLFAPESLVPTWWTAHPTATPRITGWIGGAEAVARTAGVRGDALIQAALRQLTTVFGLARGEISRLLVASRLHDWMADPQALGAYSYARAGGIDASSQLAEPIEDTVYFAGEHTDTEGHWGTVHAALASGRRAATAIISLA